jgi:hypothetical protein
MSEDKWNAKRVTDALHEYANDTMGPCTEVSESEPYTRSFEIEDPDNKFVRYRVTVQPFVGEPVG